MTSVDFGKAVKKTLIDREKTQAWLCQEITARTGLFVDGSYLNRIYNGERNAPKIVEAIRDILDIQIIPETQSVNTDST